MREIKFRAWDEIEKRLWYPEAGLKACITQIGIVCVDETDTGGILENRNYRLLASFYTGLKDKNGKDIYEGDILLDWAELPCVVLWNNESACFEAVNNKTGKFIDVSVWHKRETIGNIYENPELLKDGTHAESQ
jgi:hypothetical protein